MPITISKEPLPMWDTPPESMNELIRRTRSLLRLGWSRGHMALDAVESKL